ncbi:MAG: M1 family aminopeptidase [Gemmatimonadales bacterium]
MLSHRTVSLSLVTLPVALTLAPARPAPGQTPAAAPAYEPVYEEFRKLAPRADRAAAVRDLVLRRDVMELRLEFGVLQLLTPVADRTVGVVFVGKGSVSFVPPLEVERAHLRRVLGDSTISGPITAAVFIFADSTLAQLERSVTFGPPPPSPPPPPGTSAGELGGHVGDALDYLVDGRDRRVDANLMTALLNGTTSGFFAAYVKRERGEGVMIEIDPHEAEEVYLLRRGRLEGQRVETVCQFQRGEDLRAGVAAAAERPEPMEVEGYGITATIDRNYKFSARAIVRATGRQDDIRWARFFLYSELDVDSVVAEAGGPLTFFRADRSPDLWVRFDPPIGKGEARSVRIAYHGNLIGFGSALEEFLPPWWDASRRQMPPVLDSWAFIKATGTWYPRYRFSQPAAMDMTFRTPKGLRFASVGRLMESRTHGDTLTTRWVTELPTEHASFNIGKFEEFEIKDSRIPPVTVHINQDAHRYIDKFIPHARNAQEQVGADVANSLSFFTQVFGAPLFSRYYATEIPYFHGQAFPGMIHLSWWTFLSMSAKGTDEAFRAHEMAHQWWGIGVGPASYRDVWLSEGFAEFAGLWYMQLILQDNDKYFKQLREARQEIRRQRDRAVPIGLGSRALESRSGRYDLIVYQKGAWVLHMLRNMMLDVRTMNEDAFKAMLKDFYERYRGRRASTEDFQRVVERHVRQPMDWFFRQWVYGTAVPTYVFSWTGEPRADGKYAVRVRVGQEDVPDDFAMYVPLLIHFQDGQAMVRVKVTGPLTEASLTLPGEPKRLEFNPLESVLAEVKTEDWRE